MTDSLINLEAEAALFGALFFDAANIELAADRLAPADFAEPAHAWLFDVLREQRSTGKSTSPIALKGFIDGEPNFERLGGQRYLARLCSDDLGILGTRELIEQISELARRRRMRAGLATAANACSDLEATMAEINQHTDEAMSVLSGANVTELSAGECVSALVKSFGQDRHGVTCGSIACLDAILGPMRPTELIIGAGRPGMGKTAVALSYGLGAASRGHGVMYVSLEMSAIQLASRMAADQCFDGREGVQFNAIRDGSLNEWQYRRVREAEARIHQMPFKVVDTGHLTVGRLNMLIRRTARRMAASGQKLELVIVDYSTLR